VETADEVGARAEGSGDAVWQEKRRRLDRSDDEVETGTERETELRRRLADSKK
jgi:hypothetical protein